MEKGSNEDEGGLEAAIQSEEQEKEDHVDEEIAVQRSRERVSAGAEAMVAETEMRGERKLNSKSDSTLIYDLFRTLEARQDKKTNEHLLTSNIIPPILHQSKDQNRGTGSSRLSDVVTEEFRGLCQLKRVQHRPRRGRKQANDGFEDDLADDTTTKDQNKVDALRMLEGNR